jgi:transcriptional regulator with XRE-family HTH domain
VSQIAAEMSINQKIKQILVDKNISASHFADEIGVQRSSISHILAGRNRPSLDIIQKIVKRYPELGLDWILSSEEINDSRTDKITSERVNYKDSIAWLKPTASAPGFNQAKQAGLWDATPNSKSPVEASPKAIERILIFYTDGTFRDFTPGR